MRESTPGGKTIGEIVAADFRTARVFEKHGIDFCCGGKVALGTIYTEKDLDLATIARELEAVQDEPIDRSQNYGAWALPFLIDYIVNTHHAYLKENDEQIAAYCRNIAGVHGAHHPEVIRIAAIFDTIASDMAAHLKEEEEVFFPAVKRVKASLIAGATTDPRVGKQFRNPSAGCIASMRRLVMRSTKYVIFQGITRSLRMSAIPSCLPTRSSMSSRTTSTSMFTWRTTSSFQKLQRL